MMPAQKGRYIGVGMLLFASALNLVNAVTGLRYRDALLGAGFVVMVVLSIWLLVTLRPKQP